MNRFRYILLVLLLSICYPPLARAIEPGHSNGSITINGRAIPLALASMSKTEGLFDSSKQDTIVTLSDKPLGDTMPDDDIGISLKARTGDLAAISLRFDETKLINAKLFFKGLSGTIALPGQWFQSSFSPAGTGTVKLPKHESDGQSYECSAEFSAAMIVPTPTPADTPTPVIVEPTPTLPQATTSNIDKSHLTALFVSALMQKDEEQALKLIKLGVDPNGQDPYGVPVLNWAIMVCQPKVVQALVDKHADLTHERAPGMTVLVEAGACPEAEKILRAAGAR